MRSDFSLNTGEKPTVFFFVFFGCCDGMEREACVCDHGYERSDLCAEIIIIIIIIMLDTCCKNFGLASNTYVR